MFKVRSNKPVAGKFSNLEICKAMKENRVAKCVYVQGETRTIEPHCHGHSHAGHEVLSAYQIADASGNGGWKMFEVSKIKTFEITDEVFSLRDEFNADAPGITQVHCQSK